MKLIKNALSFLLTLAIVMVAGCSKTSDPSQLVIDLDAITLAAVPAIASVQNLSPEASACVSALPDLVTTITDVIQGSQPLPTAQQAVTNLQTLAGTQCVASVVPVKDQALVSSIANAINIFLTAYQQEIASLPRTAMLVRGYSMGFVDSTDPKKAHFKAKKADKDLAKKTAERAKKIKEAFAKTK